MDVTPSEPLLRKVDSVEVRVPDIDAGLAFYRDRLGHELIWRSKTAAALSMPESDTELVLQTERPPEPALLVESVEQAALRIVSAGGSILEQPHDIQIGRCVVAQDPWGNRLVLLDMTRGKLTTDADDNVTGDKPSS